MSRRRAAGGFTLLEMMIALAVLGMSLSWLFAASAQAVRAETHARLVTTGTFLARRVLVELEDELQEKGIQDDAFATEKSGEFEEPEFKRFRWTRLVDKIVLPGADAVQSAMGKSALGGSSGPGASGAGTGGAGAGGAGGPLGGLGIPGLGGAGGATGLAGSGPAGMLANQFGIIKEVLEQGIRRVTVRVIWTEHGAEKSVDVSEYVTDPRRVDQAIQLPNLPAMPGGLGGGASGTGTSTGATQCPPGLKLGAGGNCVPA